MPSFWRAWMTGSMSDCGGGSRGRYLSEKYASTWVVPVSEGVLLGECRCGQLTWGKMMEGAGKYMMELIAVLVAGASAPCSTSSRVGRYILGPSQSVVMFSAHVVWYLSP